MDTIIKLEDLQNATVDTIYRVEGFKHPVLLVDDGVMEMSTSQLRLANTGGAAATTFTPVWGQGFNVIVVFKELVTALKSDHLRAILLHEEGHIEHGHVEEATKPGSKVKMRSGGVFCSTAFELQADAYAAERIGKGVVIEALKETVALAINAAIPQARKRKWLRDSAVRCLCWLAFNGKEFRSRAKALS